MTKTSKKFSFNRLFKNKASFIAIALGGALLLIYSVFAYGIYKSGWDNSLTRKVATVLPYPAEKVGSSYVSYTDFLNKLDPLVNYQKNFNNVNFTNDDGKKKLKELKDSVLTQLAEEKVITAEAAKRKISVSDKEVTDSFNELIKANGGEAKVKENLNKYYNGMSLAQFKEQYHDKMLRQKLSDAIAKDESLTGDAQKKADEVLKQLKAGGDFTELAKKYSEDSSATNGGDLGFFGKGKMVPEFEKVAFGLEKGATSEIVKTVYGFHIIKVTDKKGDEIKASHILIKTKDFNAWLKDKIEQAKVKRYLKI